MKPDAVKIPDIIRRECPLPEGYAWFNGGAAPGIVFKAETRWHSWAFRQSNHWEIMHSVVIQPRRNWSGLEFDSLEDALRYLWLQFIHGDNS